MKTYRHIYFVLLLFALFSLSPQARATVIYSESWETTNINTNSSNGFYNPTSSPHYCANPDPPNDCSRRNGICAQTIGPVIPVSQIPHSTCKHSLNIGTAADGFPSPVHGSRVLRSYIDVNDADVKGHIGRSELVTYRSHQINATRTDRWWGFAFRVPDAHNAFTYDNFNFMQWHTVSYNNGGPPVLIRLHGGLRDEWRDAIGIRVEQRFGATRSEGFTTLNVNGGGVPANRIDGNGVRETFILKNTQAGGNINDFGKWMYFVIRLNLDNRSSGNNGRFTLWYASQSMINSCTGTGIDCYMKVYDYGPGFRAGYLDDNTSYVLIGGTLDVENKDNDHYPLITYYDNFKVADGSNGTLSRNFDEVNPARTTGSTPPPSTETTPDLTVLSPSVSSSNLTPGQQFSYSATVRNQGDGASESTTLRYYRSTDDIITSSDTSIGSDSVTALSAGSSTNENINATAPSAEGTYWIGACVETVSDESQTSNNCSQGTLINVSAGSPTPPDLIVQEPSVNTSALNPGQQFSFSARVRNQGGGTSASTTLRYYRSTDSTISTSDTPIGTDSVAALSGGSSSVESISATAPSALGTYWIGACVDTVSDESQTSNNCSQGTSINVSAASAGFPDLIVQNPSASEVNLTSGQQFSFSARVRNQGTGTSASTRLRYYRSTDSTISTSDTRVGSDAVASLSPGGSGVETINLNAPNSAGSYWFGACVNSVSGESPTNNNCSQAIRVTVSEPQGNPDLIVRNPGLDDSTLVTGQNCLFSATVNNNGNGTSGSTTVKYYRSDNSFISKWDTPIGNATISSLGPGSTTQISQPGKAPSSVGTYWVGACVDSVSNESKTNNNCSPGAKMTVREAPKAPDLIIQSIGVDSQNLLPGQDYYLSATILNQGNIPSTNSALRLFISGNKTLLFDDNSIVTTRIATGLAAGNSEPMTLTVTAPDSEGTYWLGACVDTVDGELMTDNNCSGSLQLNVVDNTQSSILKLYRLMLPTLNTKQDN